MSKSFQLTRPVWGEPGHVGAVMQSNSDFNSLAPCGANRLIGEAKFFTVEISTHSPRVGRTTFRCNRSVRRPYFNSLAPCGANPVFGVRYSPFTNFNSLAPCGANRPHCTPRRRRLSFQLTRPVWGEPKYGSDITASCSISTHSPRVGRTQISTRSTLLFCYFNSLAPCGANHMTSTNPTSD